jgi:hypothetical protein
MQIIEMGLKGKVGIRANFVKNSIFIVSVNHRNLDTVERVRKMRKLSNLRTVNLQVKENLGDLNVEVNMKSLF